MVPALHFQLPWLGGLGRGGSAPGPGPKPPEAPASHLLPPPAWQASDPSRQELRPESQGSYRALPAARASGLRLAAARRLLIPPRGGVRPDQRPPVWPLEAACCRRDRPPLGSACCAPRAFAAPPGRATDGRPALLSAPVSSLPSAPVPMPGAVSGHRQPCSGSPLPQKKGLRTPHVSLHPGLCRAGLPGTGGAARPSWVLLSVSLWGAGCQAAGRCAATWRWENGGSRCASCSCGWPATPRHCGCFLW